MWGIVVAVEVGHLFLAQKSSKGLGLALIMPFSLVALQVAIATSFLGTPL